MRSRARFAAISLLATLVLAMFAGVAMAQDDVTITVWSWRTEDEDAYNEIFDVYEEANPGVTVEFVPFVSTDYNNILATGLTGDGGPDVVQLRAYGGVQSLIDAGQLMPLDGEVDLSNFTDAILKGATGQADGRVYGVPFGVQALGAFYNVGVFEELGLTEVEVPYERLQDPFGIAMWPDYRGRDGCRTPMPWQTDNSLGGFTEGKPWLPMPAAHLGASVAAQDTDADSLLAFYRRIIAFRTAHPVLRKGDIEILSSDDTHLLIKRSLSGQEMLCAFNLSQEARTLELPEGAWTLEMASGFEATSDENKVTLPAWQVAFMTRAVG